MVNFHFLSNNNKVRNVLAITSKYTPLPSQLLAKVMLTAFPQDVCHSQGKLECPTTEGL